MTAKILVPIDGSATAWHAVGHMSHVVGSDTEVVFTHIRVAGGDAPATASARGALIRCVTLYRSRGVNCSMKELVAASVVEGIVQAARDEGADLILMYTHAPDDSSRQGGDRVAARVKEMSDVEVTVVGASDSVVPV